MPSDLIGVEVQPDTRFKEEWQVFYIFPINEQPCFWLEEDIWRAEVLPLDRRLRPVHATRLNIKNADQFFRRHSEPDHKIYSDIRAVHSGREIQTGTT
jgi:hypothetical protein